ncbi:MAG: FkbM family methyltransferase [Sediminibacterium sp.]|nr:FkbM family methyltransferase [Sediminibacterium sp.]
MASRFKPLIKAFGLVDGIKFYTHLLFKKYGSFYSAKYQTTFHLRSKTTDKYTFTQVFLQNQYDIELPIEPKNIVDAGANIGLASVYFAHRYKQSRVIAVEPSPDNFQVLLKNIADYKQVKALQMGIWNKDVHLFITNPTGASSSFMVAETTADNQEAIPAISIETIMRNEQWDHIDLLKIDIEGSEKELFEANYQFWLPKTKVIYIEMHDWMKKGCSKPVFRAINEYNFSFQLCNENLIFINQDY